jgi:hypothetical protein
VLFMLRNERVDMLSTHTKIVLSDLLSSNNVTY